MSKDKVLVCKNCGKRIYLISSWGRLEWYHWETNNRGCEWGTEEKGVAEPDFEEWASEGSFIKVYRQFQDAVDASAYKFYKKVKE